MHRNVETLIGRLATDPRLQSRFAEDPLEALREQGLELSEVEIAALAAIDPRAFRALTAALDPRLCRAAFPREPRPPYDPTTAGPDTGSAKETKR
jgi:hypothetical protein